MEINAAAVIIKGIYNLFITSVFKYKAIQVPDAGYLLCQ